MWSLGGAEDEPVATSAPASTPTPNVDGRIEDIHDGNGKNRINALRQAIDTFENALARDSLENEPLVRLASRLELYNQLSLIDVELANKQRR